MCGETYHKGQTDAEAAAEMREHFGDVPMDDCEIVCDDCWQKIHPADHPEQVEQTRQHVRERYGE